MKINVYNKGEFILTEGSGSVEVDINTQGQDALIIYLKYVKGSENGLIISASFKESHIPNTIFYADSYLNDNKINERTFSIDHTATLRFPIVVAQNEDKAKLVFTLDPEDGDGEVEAYIIPASPYI